MKREIGTLRPEDFEFSCDIEVRFRDVDGMGHVNNAVYATYFEMARTALMKAIHGKTNTGGGLESRFSFILLDIYCRFLSPATLDEDLVVYLRTSRLGTSSFDFEYLVCSREDGRPIAAGATTQVYYDYAGARSAPVPEDLRAALQEHSGVDAARS